jgi:hypothetical protein
MNLPMTSTLLPEQITAALAEMRKAGRAITTSSRKRLEFLRKVGVLNPTENRQRSKPKISVAPRCN